MDISAAPGRSLNVVDVSHGGAAVSGILSALEAALGGGPAILPVPEQPETVHDALIAAMRPSIAVETLDDDPVSLVVPTSGSTGEPKGVLLGTAAVTASANAAHLRLGGSGRWLLDLPATHIGGLMVLVRSVI